MLSSRNVFHDKQEGFVFSCCNPAEEAKETEAEP
jgi:hypothetical protein